MELREELLYSKSHEWVKEEGEEMVIGLTDYAQSELGDLVFVNLPEEGDELTVGEAFADVESVKAVSDVYAPVAGTVSEINEELLDAPEKINEAPYEAWLVRVKDVTEKGSAVIRRGISSICRERTVRAARKIKRWWAIWEVMFRVQNRNGQRCFGKLDLNLLSSCLHIFRKK